MPTIIDTRLRHARHYLAVLRQFQERYGQTGVSMRQLLKDLNSEWPNIQSAQVWSALNSKTNMDAAGLCSEFLMAGPSLIDLRLPPHEILRWAEPACNSSRILNRKFNEAAAHNFMGMAYTRLGKSNRAIKCFEEVLAISRKHLDDSKVCNALHHLGTAYLESLQGKRDRKEKERSLSKSKKLLEEALSIVQRTGNREQAGGIFGSLGHVYHRLNQLQLAEQCYKQQLDIARENNDRRSEGKALNGLGAITRPHCPEEAIKFYQQHLEITREMGDREGEAGAIYNTGLALCEMGRIPQGIADLEEATSIFEQLNSSNVQKAAMELAKWRRKL